ncbi:MAG: hypothetical protein GXX08_00495 [Firmicutes bacterium]|nr:hypothetical protein [Bacillota bacterium]
MARTGATCDYLNARRRLFLEMLAVTEDLNDALTIEEVTSDNLSIIDSLIDAREALMREIDTLDERHRADGNVAAPPDLGEQDAAGTGQSEDGIDEAVADIKRATHAMVALQQQIDQRLQRHKSRAEERVREVRLRRSSLSGYYNAEVASRPRYVDARK